MKVAVLFFICVLYFSLAVVAQKKPIDPSAYKKWSELWNPYITSDGRYVSYTVANRLTNENTFRLAAASNNWSKEFPGVMLGEPVADDKFFLVKSHDTLNLVKPGDNKTEQFKVLSYSHNKSWLFFQQDTAGLYFKRFGERSLHHLAGIGKIAGYHFFPKIKVLVVKVENGEQFDIKIADLESGELATIASLLPVKFITEDTVNNQLAYVWGKDNAISVYDCANRHSAALLPGTGGIIKNYAFSFPLRFSKDGKRFFFTLEKADTTKKLELADVNIWSYKDPANRDAQYFGSRSAYTVSVALPGGQVTLLGGGEGSRLELLEDGGDKYALLTQDSLSPFRAGLTRSRLISSVDGTEIYRGKHSYITTPGLKYLLYFDGKDYQVHDLEKNEERNLTAGVNNNWTTRENGDYDFWNYIQGIVSWGEDNESVYVCDQYDIWKLDLAGRQQPVCVTNGYGRKHKIIFSLVSEGGGFNAMPGKIDGNKEIVFSAFNTLTKENGFYRKSPASAPGDPEMLIMQPCTYWVPVMPLSFAGLSSGFTKPLKAKHAAVWLLTRATATSAPNYLVTKDFKHFTQLTNNAPEKEYNWYTTELVNWKTARGIELQGVLYKPENFDSTKKYPLIFYHYRKASANLHAYITPQACAGCIIDIPTYVSNGYLVFTPDIYFFKGETGKSALEAISSAADVLVTRPYVDSLRLGIQGCSFSGFTTNYIVTHSSRFAAAVSASGLADMVSGYNSINTGEIKQYQFEEGGPYQMGGTLWDLPETYIRNSAVFSAPQLTTPLLLMHTTKDFTVPFFNAMEFFLAGKRLGKKIWLLEYGNNNSHVVMGKEGDDFTLRMRQFFDHYLKGAPPARWMTEGRSPNLRDTDAALDIDTSGRIP